MKTAVLYSWVHCLEKGMCPNQVEPQVAILSPMLYHFILIRAASDFVNSQAVYMCWISCHWTQIPDKAT